MTLPSSASPCDISDDVCCNVVFDIAEHLLNNVYEALLDCYDDTICNKAPIAYVTMGTGDDGVSDSLTVAIVAAFPSPGTTSGKGGTTVPLGLYRCVYDVRLRESGWPMAHTEGNAVHTPDPDMQMAVARHAYSHGEMMYRKLNRMLRERNITPSTVPQYSNVIIGTLYPLNPSGGTVGFTAQVTIDLPWGWAGT